MTADGPAPRSHAVYLTDRDGHVRMIPRSVVIAAIKKEAEADRKYGHPLDYNDPTGVVPHRVV